MTVRQSGGSSRTSLPQLTQMALAPGTTARQSQPDALLVSCQETAANDGAEGVLLSVRSKNVGKGKIWKM